MTFGIVGDPYRDVDWESVEQYRTEIHAHPRGDEHETPRDVWDLYVGELGYDVMSINGVGETVWPLEDEGIDPEADGVIAFPAMESRPNEHVHALFSTIDDSRIHAHDPRSETIRHILGRRRFDEPRALAVYAHPQGYADPDEWGRYEDELVAFSRERGLVGVEVYNGWDGDAVELWDELLANVRGDVLAFGADDPRDEFVVGEDVDRRWTSVLLEPERYDPAEQADSRAAIVEAITRGRLLAHERDPFDEGRSPSVPSVDSIDVDVVGGTLSIESSDADETRWISDGVVVETGPTVRITDELGSYVRAELVNGRGVTATQAWQLGEFSAMRQFSDRTELETDLAVSGSLEGTTAKLVELVLATLEAEDGSFVTANIAEDSQRKRLATVDLAGESQVELEVPGSFDAYYLGFDGLRLADDNDEAFRMRLNGNDDDEYQFRTTDGEVHDDESSILLTDDLRTSFEHYYTGEVRIDTTGGRHRIFAQAVGGRDLAEGTDLWHGLSRETAGELETIELFTEGAVFREGASVHLHGREW
ncbi:hypothetical protein [Natronococcus sp. A-GB7]|uniref:hypothetical protein n=1 Tax=Natronococcus sp. A-GB7 TaxID=3037649 RepID=UPI00241FB1D7|nr:hypothetical protein [Natronococcus sp. A-GB7]MDG5819759.1 hypothetical protein [Natronococcus sp. A-GB7]